MKIALCSIGSRGDIQPFLVLGEYLAQRGHTVKVASAKLYQTLASKYEVDYIYFEGDYESLLDDEAMKKAIGRNPFTIGKKLKEKVYPILENSLETFFEVTAWADVVIYHPKTMIDSIAFEQQRKLLKAYVVPAFTPTKAFKNPILTFLPLPNFLYKLTYKFANAMMGTVKTPINNFKKKYNLAKSPPLLDTPIIYGISPSFLNRPDDYPHNHYFTGFWSKRDSSQKLSQDVLDFMSDSKKVLIMTFGSMPYKSDIDINRFVEAILEKYDLKILLVKAWGLKGVSINTHTNIKAIDTAPFDLLFPLANFVLHHGGAGTTATALRAGIPQMICPVLHPVGDQYFWGKQLKKIGVGAKPIPLNKLSIPKLLKGIEQLQQEELAIKAQQLSQQIQTEDGLKTASEIIEKHFQNKSC